MPAMIAPVNKKRISIQIAAYWMIILFFWQNGYCSIDSHEANVVKAVRKASPTVVNISSQYEIRKNSNPFSGYAMDPRTDCFLCQFFSPEFKRREKRTRLGSGVIIDGTRDLVLTNNPVVEKATTISVALNNQHEFEATMVGMDPNSDLALLKIRSNQRSCSCMDRYENTTMKENRR
jgi:serine protease Do